MGGKRHSAYVGRTYRWTSEPDGSRAIHHECKFARHAPACVFCVLYRGRPPLRRPHARTCSDANVNKYYIFGSVINLYATQLKMFAWQSD
eukprot:363221-Chlamydomonas_euryale.AAC.19